MFIPKEFIWFVAGFLTFPIVCYIVYKAKGWDKEERKEEKDKNV